jgi:hypothetical protein
MFNNRFGDAIEGGLKIMFGALCIFVPLGLWKLVEILFWLCKHIKITIN